MPVTNKQNVKELQKAFVKYLKAIGVRAKIRRGNVVFNKRSLLKTFKDLDPSDNAAIITRTEVLYSNFMHDLAKFVDRSAGDVEEGLRVLSNDIAARRP